MQQREETDLTQIRQHIANLKTRSRKDPSVSELYDGQGANVAGDPWMRDALGAKLEAEFFFQMNAPKNAVIKRDPQEGDDKYEPAEM